MTTTPLFERPITRHELAMRQTVVTRVTRPAPDLVRVTVSSPEFATLGQTGPTDHVKLFFPDPESGVVYTFRDDRAKAISRDFTPLRHTDEELDLDFYTHEDPGPAAAWALAAKPGDELVVAGPRGSRGVPAGARTYVLVADETALPSVTQWVALAPEDVAIEVIATVNDDGGWVQDYIGHRARVTITAPTADAAIAALTARGEVDETTFVWAAGEAALLIPVRRHLRHTLGLSASQSVVNGYWRAGETDFDHHAPLDPAAPDEE